MKKRLLVIFFGVCLVLTVGLTVFTAKADAVRALDPKTVRILDVRGLDPKTVRILDEGPPEPENVGIVEYPVPYERCLCPKIVRIFGPPGYIETP